MSVFQDWAELARSTFRSLTREDVTGFYKREWPEARRQLVSEHREAIEGERKRWKRWLRVVNAVIFGLTRRLAPVRRVLFALALFLAVVDIFAIRVSVKEWDLRVGGVNTFVAFLIVACLLAMELVDKLAYRDELELARDLQATLVTSNLPTHESFELGAYNRIANMVGGDLYEFAVLPDGSLALLFGDASGHGMAAGLVMAVAHAGFRTQLQIDPSSRGMVAALNRILCATGSVRSFFSCVYLRIFSDGKFSVTVAGHPPVARIDRDGRITQRLGEGSYPLGIRASSQWEPIDGTLSPGETLLLYSDGLYEACDERGTAFGEERIDSLVRLFAGAPPAELVRELAQHLLSFCGSAVPEDDISIAAIRSRA
jgi:phosphoserine phosphatase RsbU/P